MNIVIRDYTPKDYCAIQILWEEVGLGSAQRGDVQQIIEQSIAMGGRLLLAVLPSGEIIGTSWMTFDGRRLHLHHFGVSIAYQRMGVGDKLTVESLRFAKQKGFQIKLEVHKTNTAAIGLYKKHGFQFLGDYDVYIIRDIQSING